MNLNTLTGMYGDLSAEERASMMFAALSRDDETEVNRLMGSAPMLNRRMSHHTVVAGGFCPPGTASPQRAVGIGGELLVRDEPIA